MRRLLYTFIVSILLLILTATPVASASLSPKLHPMIPFTTSEHMKMCSEVMDIEKIYQDSLHCTIHTLYPEDVALISEEKVKALHDIVDNCFVITNKSPDIYSTEEFNYVKQYHFFGMPILGFYDPRLKVTYITENTDMIEITEHEIQHHILNVLEIGDGDHTHPVWSSCRPPRYSPSEKARKGNPYKKTGKYVKDVEGFPSL